VMTWNSGAEEIIGYKPREIIGSHISVFYTPGEIQRNEQEKNLEQALLKGRFEDEGWRVRKDGSEFWANVVITALRDPKGELIGFAKVTRDITRRKRAEDEVARLNAELKKQLEREIELSELKSRFIALASHEFRTPLTAILSSASLISRYKESNQDQNRQVHIDRIKSSVSHLTDILDDFLSIEKLEAGKIQCKWSRFNLHDFLKDIIAEMRGMLDAKSQLVDLFFEGPSEICQDKKILSHIILNLLSNASKYSENEKKIRLEVVVGVQNARFIVTDEGIGIPKIAQDHLFSKFFRADNTGSVHGTGLGLNIVKKYIEILNGSISFSSQENIGSSFTVDLPLPVI
jgi:PAS domain S-box-containing protein